MTIDTPMITSTISLHAHSTISRLIFISDETNCEMIIMDDVKSQY